MHLLDLPTEILRQIFAELTDEDLFSNLRNASIRLRSIADDIVQLSKLIFNKGSKILLILYKVTYNQNVKSGIHMF